ncbi:hypothetical protein [Streptomyces sp. SAJ15]|uniref:hypothetical protein n=1 Tax=Streptomyces sp. SAJ15 TaxID=2011095 RepID=UPI0011854C7C|nr:hypothetical protein [Streptomyces sp. SAJ15]TVL90709.1 hypothetical protein CD790_19105 [Streptomyces sp. SAJ15]
MRTPHRAAAAALIAAFAVAASEPPAAPTTPPPAPVIVPAAENRPRHASCDAWVHGSHATASCFNPYPRADRVQLHVECERWWDPDLASRPVDIAPAQHIRVSERCWKEIAEAWVSHLR